MADPHDEPLYAQLCLERWRPRRGWASSVQPILQRLLDSGWQIAAPLEDGVLEDWQKLVIMLGDTHAAPLCLLVLEHLQSLLPPILEDRGLLAHRDLCLFDLELATPLDPEGVAIKDLGAPELMARDEARIAAWVARQLEPFAGDLGRAVVFIVRLSAIRTGLLEGPEPTTVAEVLDNPFVAPPVSRG